MEKKRKSVTTSGVAVAATIVAAAVVGLTQPADASSASANEANPSISVSDVSQEALASIGQSALAQAIGRHRDTTVRPMGSFNSAMAPTEHKTVQ